jgi:hypothetical protein
MIAAESGSLRESDNQKYLIDYPEYSPRSGGS